MATIHHEDTYTCDLCGKEIERATTVQAPILSILRNDHGQEISRAITVRALDLCEDCVKDVVRVKLDLVEYEDPTGKYKLIEDKKVFKKCLRTTSISSRSHAKAGV